MSVLAMQARGWSVGPAGRSGEAGAGRQRRVHLSALAASPLDDYGGQVRLLHDPDMLDQLWDGNGVWLTDAEHDQTLRRMVGQLRARLSCSRVSNMSSRRRRLRLRS